MRISLPLLAIACLSATAVAQNKSLIFTGRFPFKSLDAVNERVGGSINNLEEFDFSFVTPGAGAFARSLQTSTAHEAYYGNAAGTGNFTKLAGFKTYFQNIQMGGVFVKHADKASATHAKVFFTVRSNAAPLQFEAFINNGTAVHILRPGDFVRFTGNGNLEFFCTQDQLDIAAGLPPVGQSSAKGASAMCQDAAGNLYYSPASGGHWVNGGLAPVFAGDGAIVQIDAANITYDGLGNVASIAPNCARMLVDETVGGTSPSPLTTRQMVLNAQSYDRAGVAIAVAGVFGKVTGLDLDPNGGTFLSRWPDPSGAYTLAPNFVFTSDAGGYAGTIWSTALNSTTLVEGSVAVINGVTCGSLVAGVPADGSWLGVQLDVPNFQPSLMGLCLVDEMAFEPMVLDLPGFGAIQPTQTTVDIDVHGLPGSIVIVFGDFPTGGFPLSVPSSLLPFPLAAGSHAQVFPIVAPIDVGINITDPFGYATFSVPNPNTGSLTGLAAVLQGALVDLATNRYTISNPAMLQFK